MIYHASQISGLKMLLPHATTHGKEYVYAINDRITAVCFGAPKDDFDILMDDAEGKTVIYECYPGALERVYSGKSCSLYAVKEDGFLRGQTGWDAELVSEKPACVVSEEIIPDIYDHLLSAADRGECVINRYSEDDSYISMLRDELSERIKAFGITKEKMSKDERFIKYLSDILK